MIIVTNSNEVQNFQWDNVPVTVDEPPMTVEEETELSSKAGKPYYQDELFNGEKYRVIV